MEILVNRTTKFTSNPGNKAKRLLIVQYAGDYREAYYRLRQGGEETYYAQRYSVNLTLEYKNHCQEVGVLVLHTDEVYDEVLPDAIRAIGAGFKNNQIDNRQLLNLVSRFRPTHLVVCTPYPPLLQWAIRHRVRTLVVLADSFEQGGFKQQIKKYWLSRLLNNPWIDWVANHGINSAKSLQAIGVDPNRIIPWDWPAVVTPFAFEPKSHIATPDQINLLFAGAVQQSKGIGDVFKAISLLKRRGSQVWLKVAGEGQIEEFKRESQRLGIHENVEFLGLVPHQQVVHLMREADVVLVPSRHDYAEGLPMTIYEGLCSRSPIVASDHRMFDERLQHEVNALIFPAGDVVALADCIDRLYFSPTLYHQLSVASAAAWENLQITVKRGELIEHWLSDLPDDRRWLFEHRLSSTHYTKVPEASPNPPLLPVPTQSISVSMSR
ncbi:MAG: glycosyltransferase family 4 protein [Leptolyngbyaceae cyanobacterium bins.349]|nr:glycosyltransferase family 4 protein [Leptolyngbyaceae cyanobacterium bins.349]